MNANVSANAADAVPVRKMARVALVDLDQDTTAALTECFHQFGIASVSLGHEDAGRFQTEKFDACALRLDDHAERVLNLARSAPANFRMVVYGLAETPAQSLRFSRYGINAVLIDPVDKRAALRAVRATHLLIVHEFRRYVRIPLVTPVKVNFEGSRITGTSVEISGGGMSITARKLPPGLVVELEFALPNAPLVRVNASVRWFKDGELGLRFEEGDPGRTRVHAWIDKYLGIA